MKVYNNLTHHIIEFLNHDCGAEVVIALPRSAYKQSQVVDLAESIKGYLETWSFLQSKIRWPNESL